MKLREEIFLVEFLILLFLSFGIAGNIDLGISTPIRYYIVLFISMFLTFTQMKYIEKSERREEKRRCIR